MTSHGTPQNTILTASYQSFGPAIGIGTAVTPNTTFAIGGDLGLSDDGSNSRFSVVNTNAYVNVGTDTNNRGFMLWENADQRIRFGTKESGVNHFSTMHLQSGRVGIGALADSGMDLHVKGTNKTAIIGENANPPAEHSKLFLGNSDTYIGHVTTLGGHMVMQSTASIIFMLDKTIGASETQQTWLKLRNSSGDDGFEDVDVEAPGGLKVRNNLNLTGSLHIKNDNSTYERVVVSGSGHDVVSIAPSGTPQLKINKHNGGASFDLSRIDNHVSANDVLAEITMHASETGGADMMGGAKILSKATANFNPGSQGESQLEFWNTKDSDNSPTLAGYFMGARNNRLVISDDIMIEGNNVYNANNQSVLEFIGTRDAKVLGDLIVGDNIIKNNGAAETITMNASGDVTIAGNLQAFGGGFLLTGSSPTIGLGAGVSQDLMIHLNGQVNDYYVGYDVTDQELHIGNGNTAGTGTAIKINPLALTSSLPMEVGDGLSFSATTNQGIMNSPGVRLNNSYGTSSSAERYIKIAEFPAAPTLGSTDGQVTNLLLTVTGREYSSSYTADLSLLVNVRYTFYADAPYYYAVGTSVSVTPLGNDFAEMGDVFYPSQQLFLTTGPGGNPELWLESSISGDASRYLHKYASVFVTHLGGSGNSSTSYTNAALKLMDNGLSEWTATDPKAVADREVIYAHYSDAYAGPGTILEEVQISGATAHDVTNSQSYIATSAGNNWEATFIAPRSGAVHITVQFMAKYMASDTYLAMGLTDESGSIYTDCRMRMVGGSRYSAANWDYETIQYTFRLDGLTPGASTTVRPVVDGAENPSGSTGGYTAGEIVIVSGAVPASNSAWANAQGRILVQTAAETHGYSTIS